MSKVDAIIFGAPTRFGNIAGQMPPSSTRPVACGPRARSSTRSAGLATAIPRTASEGATLTLIAGRSDGLVSPVRTYSDMVYADIALEDAARYQVKAEHIERAVYVVSGALEVIGQAGRFEAGELVDFKPGAELVLRAAGATRAYPATANSSPCLRTRRPQAPLRREERGSTMAQGTARIGRDHYCTQIDLASGQTLVSDEPSVLGGEGAGATPYELVIAGLGHAPPSRCACMPTSGAGLSNRCRSTCTCPGKTTPW